MHEHPTAVPTGAGSNPSQPTDERLESQDESQHGASHSMWWMVICCIPMVLIFVAVLLGAFGAR